MPIQVSSKGLSFGGVNYAPYAYIDWFTPQQEGQATQGGDAFYVPARALTPAQTAQVASIIGVTGTNPDTPKKVLAIANDGSASVFFDPAPRATGYTVTASNGATAQGAASPIKVLGLTNGVPLTFQVTASNSSGSVTSAASNAVTPTSRPVALAGIDNIISWWEADALPVVADGTAVSSWIEVSGNGYHLAQAIGARQPVYKTAGNWGGGGSGKPAVRFSQVGSDWDEMNGLLTSILTGPVVTWFLVFSITTGTNGQGGRDMRIVTNELTRGDGGFCVCANDGNGGANGAGGAGNWHSVRGGVTNNSGSAIATNTIYILSIVTGKQFFVNGVRQPTKYGGIEPLLQRDNPFNLGAVFGQNTAGASVDMAVPGLVVRGAQPDAQRQAVEALFGTKYGVSMAVQATV
jgi:hypothetical protein